MSATTLDRSGSTDAEIYRLTVDPYHSMIDAGIFNEDDRDTKVPLYASHDIPEVWPIDLKKRRLAIYRDPGPEDYRQILIPDENQVVALLLLPGVELKVSELWE